MIEIFTKLNNGIRDIGGKEIKQYKWNKTSGRNLLIATKKLIEHKEEMKKCYGNIGCGNSWIRINGKDIDSYLLTFIIVHNKLYTKEERNRIGNLTKQFQDFLNNI